MKLKVTKILSISFLAIAGIFGVASALINAHHNNNMVVEEARGEGTDNWDASAPVIEFHYYDKGGSKATDTYRPAVLILFNISYDSTSTINSVSSIISDGSSYRPSVGDAWWEDGGCLYIKMFGQAQSSSQRHYASYLPWFIQSCSFKMCVQYWWDSDQKNHNYYFVYQGQNGHWSNNVYRGQKVSLTTEDADNNTYGCWTDGGSQLYRAGKYTFTEISTGTTTTVQGCKKIVFNSNGGTSVDTKYIYPTQKTTAPNNPILNGCSFIKWTIGSDPSSSKFSFGTTIDSDKSLYAQYATPLQTKRIWLWRSTHYVNTGEEWRIWNGVDGDGTYVPSAVHINSSSTVWLVYYDLPLSIMSINFQIYTNNSYTTTPVSSITYTAGQNSYLWVVNKVNESLVIDTDGTVNSMSGLSTDWKVDADFLSHVFEPYLTCNNDSDNGYANIDTVYSTWVYGSGGSYVQGEVDQAGANAVLAATTIDDYSYNGGNYSYLTPSKTSSTSIYDKYVTMVNMKSHQRVSNSLNFNYVFLANTDNNAPMIIIIITSSVALLSITALSVLVVKKKKRETN